MLIDRILFCLSDNPYYADYWEFTSKVWRNKFGAKPTLLFYGNPSKVSINEKCGEVIYLPFVDEVSVDKNRDWACTWGLFYGATLFPEEVCMTSGIDQIPLSDRFLQEISSYDYEKDYVVGFADAYGHNPATFPSSHHVAKGRIYKKALSIDDDWETEVKKVFRNRNKYSNLLSGFWGLDEAYSSELLFQYPNLVRKLNMKDFASRRVDRSGDLTINTSKLVKGEYSEIHGPRPFSQYKKYLDIIYDLIPSYL